MQINRAFRISILLFACAQLHAADPPKPAAAKKAEPTKPAPTDDSSDEEEKAAKKAPHRFIPTDKGNADDDIPFPVDI